MLLITFCKSRQCNIIWFNSPFSKNASRRTLQAVAHCVRACTHLPVSHNLHRIFNRNTVKVSYNCMSNVKSTITSHITRIIRKSQPHNCSNTHACPLQNKCMSKDIVYQATINAGNTRNKKKYNRMTSSTFKERYRNHIKSFTHKKNSDETDLSKHVWYLKQNRFDNKVVMQQ